MLLMQSQQCIIKKKSMIRIFTKYAHANLKNEFAHVYKL